MSQSQISDAATVIQLLFAAIAFCLAVINGFFFFILRRIKKNSDDVWSKINENRKRCDTDHDRITIIETKLKIDNGDR